MIKANELRIGNLLNVYSYEHENDRPTGRLIKSEVEVFGIIRHPPNNLRKLPVLIFLKNGQIGEHYLNDDVTPILLTPEWLERFGLKDTVGNGMAYRMDISSQDELCWYMQDGFLRYQSKGSGFTRSLEHIKHIHQLQNFYWWLTGKELTFAKVENNKSTAETPNK